MEPISITIILIALTTLTSFLAFNKPVVTGRFTMSPYVIAHRKQYYRFITSGFIHANHIHLLVNMFSFYFFGTAVEMIFNIIFGDAGPFYFVALYLTAIVVSDWPVYFKHRNDYHYHSLGASGGVAAIIFAFIIFQPLERICIYFVFCLPGVVLGIAYLVYSYYQGRKANDHINHEAHLYGALFGLLFCILFYPRSLMIFYEQIRQWISGGLFG